MYSSDGILYTWSRFHSTRLFFIAVKHFEVFSYLGPHACKRSKVSSSVQSADLARDLFPLAVTFVTSESLEAAEEEGGVLAASGIGDSVRQGTIRFVN